MGELRVQVSGCSFVLLFAGDLREFCQFLVGVVPTCGFNLALLIFEGRSWGLSFGCWGGGFGWATVADVVVALLCLLMLLLMFLGKVWRVLNSRQGVVILFGSEVTSRATGRCIIISTHLEYLSASDPWFDQKALWDL